MKDFEHRDPAPGNRDPKGQRTRKKRKTLTQRDKEQLIALNALADLLSRDATEIATDPRYAIAEHAPLPIVGELQRQSRALRQRARKQ